MQAVAPLEKVMKRFVMRQNIEHYRALLGVTADHSQRRGIEQLLHDEEAKLKKYDDQEKIARPQQDGLINQALIAPAARRQGRVSSLVSSFATTRRRASFSK